MFGLFRVQTSVGTVLGIHKGRRELVHCFIHDISPAMPAAFIYLPERTYGLAFMAFDNPDGLPFAPRHAMRAGSSLVFRYARQPLPAQYAFCHPHTGRFLAILPALDEDRLGGTAYHTDGIGTLERFNLLGLSPGEVTPPLASFMQMVDALTALPPTPGAWSELLSQSTADQRQQATHILSQALTPGLPGPLSQAALVRPGMPDVLRRSFPDDPWATRALPAVRRLALAGALPDKPARQRPGLARRLLGRLLRARQPAHPDEPPRANKPIGPELDMLATAGADGSFASLPHQAAVLHRRTLLPRQDCCILATARNEGVYLLDWIAHHRSIGFDRIILYTNGNDDGSDALLSALAAAGEITWHPSVVGPGGSPQGKAYGHALGFACDVLDYRWCAVIDLDEYVGFDAGRFGSFKEYLNWQEVRAVDAIALNWLMFSSSDQVGWGPAPVAERFRYRLPGVNSHVKSVFRPGRFHHAGPHFPATDAAQSTVFRTAEGGLHKPGWDGAAPTMSEAPCADTAWVSHYFFRSAEEYLSKFSRTRGDHPYQAGRIEVPAGFVDAFVDQAATADRVLDERTLGCAPRAVAFKAGLLAIPTVANAARLVARRFAETRAASRPVIDGLAAAAPDDSQRRFYAMVQDSIEA